ncbi:MAG: DM13 domain-containing protein [Acidobacteria bacterium]|nr:DM13 domain-containing protein [Acidobacteriota bacterium]
MPDADPRGRDDITGYVDLGGLKGNIGDQNYEIPSGNDVSGYGSVVIYCRPFQVIFSVAILG